METENIWVAIISALAGSGIGAGVLEVIRRWMDKKSDREIDSDRFHEGYQKGRADANEQSQRNEAFLRAIIAEKESHFKQMAEETDAQHKRDTRRLEKVIDQAAERLECVEAELETKKEQFTQLYTENLKLLEKKAADK